MGVLKRLKDRLASPSVEDVHRERAQRGTTSHETPAFYQNITWRCQACGEEYWENDQHESFMVCFHCGHEHEHQYNGGPDLPAFVRAKCLHCGEMSDVEHQPPRLENIHFKCEYCEWEWVSDPY